VRRERCLKSNNRHAHTKACCLSFGLLSFGSGLLLSTSPDRPAGTLPEFARDVKGPDVINTHMFIFLLDTLYGVHHDDDGEGIYVCCSMHAQVDVGKRLEGWEEEEEEEDKMREGKKIVFIQAGSLSRESTSACLTQPLWLCDLLGQSK